MPILFLQIEDMPFEIELIDNPRTKGHQYSKIMTKGKNSSSLRKTKEGPSI
jgi:hypothetical protein